MARRRVAMWVVLAVLALAMLAGPVAEAATARCRVTTVRGQGWLVCPCRAVAGCEDWWRVPAWRR